MWTKLKFGNKIFKLKYQVYSFFWYKQLVKIQNTMFIESISKYLFDENNFILKNIGIKPFCLKY